MMTFDECFAKLIGHEGELSNHPADKGGLTKYGISQRAYPALDIAALTLDTAKEIYRRDFWDILGEAHSSIKFQVFDAAVNHGHGNAIRFLQRAVGVADDGAWGKVSQAALNRMETNDVLLRFVAYRLKFWASLRTFDIYGRGWTNRGAENLLFAAEDN